MQTFLPFADFQQAAKVLDWRRLGKQRVESKQINMALKGEYTRGWVNHPATLMWKGYEAAHCLYAIAICTEWRGRSYNDSLLPYFEEQLEYWDSIGHSDRPHWLGDEAFHSSHRSNLLRKDAVHYGKFGWVEPNNLEYVWPKGRQV